MNGDLTNFETRCTENIRIITNSYGAVTRNKGRANVMKSLRREMGQEVRKEMTELEVMEL